MKTDDTSAPARDQDNVWDYYQTEGVAIFDFAVPRLAYLFRVAKRTAGAGPISALNIGIGNGWLERRCHQAGWDSWGLDPNRSAVEALGRMGVHGVESGIEAMPFEDHRFDVVFCSEVLEHLRDDLLHAGLVEIARVLKPRGWMIGSVPCEEDLLLKRVVCPKCNYVHHAFGHHQSFGRERLTSLFRAGGLDPVFFRIRAFPPFAARDFEGKLKSFVWFVLGRLGAQAADSKIVFAARRGGQSERSYASRT